MKQIIEKIKDEICYEKEFAKSTPIFPNTISGQTLPERNAFIGGLERALEIAIEEHDLADPKPEEVDHMASEASDLINALVNVIEQNLPEYYSRSDLILKCDMWLKWENEESDPAELKEFFNYPN